MLPASRAAWVPVFMATPTSACASAGASLVPSPVIATSRPSACCARISSILASGVASARKSSTPDSSAILAAVSRLSPVTMTVRMPIRRSRSKRSAMPSLTTSLSSMTPSTCASRATASGVEPSRATRSSSACERRRRLAALVGDPAQDRVARALAQARAVEVDAAHAGLRGEGDELRVLRLELVLAQPVLLGEHDDRAALGRLVGQRRVLRRLGQLGLLHPGHRDEGGGLAVAERDRAGLVEQQHVDVAGRLDGAAGQREHVAAHEPVHAGDADRAQQRADRRRDQRHQQRDQDRDRDVGAGELGERPQRDDDGEEHDGQAREQDRQRDLVRRLAPLGALDERDHAVEERLARLLRDLDHDVVGQHARAAGDRAAVAAGLADDRRGLAGDRRLVDRGDALDHGAVAGDHLAGLDDHHVAADELVGGLGRAVREAARRSACASRAARRPAPCRGPRRSPRRSCRTGRSATARSRP